MSDITLALLYGLIEGLTEFIPVSSTGHLVILADLLKDYEPRVKTFSIFIQGGAILAGLLYYRKRFFDLFKTQPGNSFSGFSGLLKLGLACLPACLFALLFRQEIKSLLSPVPVAWALIVGAGLFFWVARKKGGSGLDTLNWKHILLIGAFQCLSLWPGFSRSGSVIIGAVFAGLSIKAASDFAFILGVPILTMAAAYELLSSLSELNISDTPFFLTGFLSSFIFGYLSISLCLKLIQKFSLVPFACYRIVLGLIILFLI